MVVGASLVAVLYLQVRFNLVVETVQFAVDTVQFARRLVDGCGTSLCCEDCLVIGVSRVIDGDTFVSSGGMRVRLFGVDTPEVGERCSSTATDRLRELAGDEVRVENGPRFIDPYGRRLYYVYAENGESIDEKLVQEGLARAWTRDGQHGDTLMRLESEARRGREDCLW
jgi:hypothetical protein